MCAVIHVPAPGAEHTAEAWKGLHVMENQDYFEGLQTEASGAAARDLDTLSPLAAARVMNMAEDGVTAAIEKALPQIAQLVEKISGGFTRGGRLIYAGAGTSGRLGVLDASECPPTFGVREDVVAGIIAGGDAALRSAVEGAEDDEEQGREALRHLRVTHNDTVVAISASGWAPWCVGILKQAAEDGAYPAALVCNEDTVLAKHAKTVITVVTGPEILAGSTRLKAGTATKRVLNMLSTLSFIRIGKVYGSLMVDVKLTNIKLRARAKRIVAQAVKVDVLEAERLLTLSKMQVKEAIVMGILGCGLEEAKQRLERSGGFVRGAI